MTKLTACALTMVRDDYEFLKIWVNYYARELGGRDRLYVVVHGDDPEIINIAQGCSIIQIPFLPDQGSFESLRRKMLRGFIAGLLCHYENVLVVDVDEILIANPASGKSLELLLAEIDDGEGYQHALGFDLVQWKDRENLPVDVDRPILSQRRFGRVNSHYCKPCVIRRDLRMTAHRVIGGPFALNLDLVLVHLKAFDETIFQRVQRRRRQAAQAYPNEPHLHYWKDDDASKEYLEGSYRKDESPMPLKPYEFEWLGPRIERGIGRRKRVVSILSGPLEVSEDMLNLF